MLLLNIMILKKNTNSGAVMKKSIETIMRILHIFAYFKRLTLKLKWTRKSNSLVLEHEFIGYESFSVYTLERLKDV